MKKLYKLTCSNCNKSLGTIFLEDEISRPQYLPLLLIDEVYNGEIKALSIGNDIKSRIYCPDCADMEGEEE